MKQTIKSACRIIARIFVLPFITIYLLGKSTKARKEIFSTIGQLLALIPGKPGSFMRVAFYSKVLKEFSQNCHIDFGSYLAHPEVHIEDHVSIGAYCIIGKCHIGRDSIIGSAVNILSGKQQHNFTSHKIPIRLQGGKFTPIIIGADCWIGNNATIMADVGTRSVIGAGSVVSKPIPDFSIAAGNPCQILR